MAAGPGVNRASQRLADKTLPNASQPGFRLPAVLFRHCPGPGRRLIPEVETDLTVGRGNIPKPRFKRHFRIQPQTGGNGHFCPVVHDQMEAPPPLMAGSLRLDHKRAKNAAKLHDRCHLSTGGLVTLSADLLPRISQIPPPRTSESARSVQSVARIRFLRALRALCGEALLAYQTRDAFCASTCPSAPSSSSLRKSKPVRRWIASIVVR